MTESFVMMIEKKTAVDSWKKILCLEGIDMVQWGGADYCMSIGRPGTWDDPEVQAVERKVIEACYKMAVPPRAEISSLDQAKYYLDFGVRHFCTGMHIVILHDWLKENGEKLQKAISEGQSGQFASQIEGRKAGPCSKRGKPLSQRPNRVSQTNLKGVNS